MKNSLPGVDCECGQCDACYERCAKRGAKRPSARGRLPNSILAETGKYAGIPGYWICSRCNDINTWLVASCSNCCGST